MAHLEGHDSGAPPLLLGGGQCRQVYGRARRQQPTMPLRLAFSDQLCSARKGRTRERTEIHSWPSRSFHPESSGRGAGVVAKRYQSAPAIKETTSKKPVTNAPPPHNLSARRSRCRIARASSMASATKGSSRASFCLASTISLPPRLKRNRSESLCANRESVRRYARCAKRVLDCHLP